MKNLTLQLNFLKSEKFKEIQNYLDSQEFQKDFPCGYWESDTNSSGKILTIGGLPSRDYFSNVEIYLRDDEDLNIHAFKENEFRLAKHYKKLIDIIYSKK